MNNIWKHLKSSTLTFWFCLQIRLQLRSHHYKIEICLYQYYVLQRKTVSILITLITIKKYLWLGLCESSTSFFPLALGAPKFFLINSINLSAFFVTLDSRLLWWHCWLEDKRRWLSWLLVCFWLVTDGLWPGYDAHQFLTLPTVVDMIFVLLLIDGVDNVDGGGCLIWGSGHANVITQGIRAAKVSWDWRGKCWHWHCAGRCR